MAVRQHLDEPCDEHLPIPINMSGLPSAEPDGLDLQIPTPPPDDIGVRHGSTVGELPEEIIENIAECLRYPIYPAFEATEAFLVEGHSGFSTIRFYLSAFSKVSRSIRLAVERLLYRDIHLDITGWTRHIQSFETEKHPIWPAGCLRLLLRTLDERPELARFVRSVTLRWPEHELLAKTVQERLQFLLLCPGLQSLSLSSMPESLLEPLESLRLRITSFAAVTSAANLPRIIHMFPALDNLHLHIHGEPAPLIPIPDHRISCLHLRVVGERDLQLRLLSLAFAVPQSDVRTLYLEGHHRQSNVALVNFPSPTRSMRTSVEHLRLKTINPFGQVEVGDGSHSPLTAMGALRHLHVIRPFLLPTDAFSYLPPNLRSITFSDYALDSKKTSAESKGAFVQSVADCLIANSHLVGFAGIKTYGAVPDDPWELGDLTPLQSLCNDQRVPFVQVGSYADIEPELMIFCEFVRVAVRPC
ncbi:hypothetical protein C8R46DRAFT_1098081 [Mycena filopes]|nr:hypothetical protein C8R46DRAFT_1098081 [Mycena filopes]